MDLEEIKKRLDKFNPIESYDNYYALRTFRSGKDTELTDSKLVCAFLGDAASFYRNGGDFSFAGENWHCEHGYYLAYNQKHKYADNSTPETKKPAITLEEWKNFRTFFKEYCQIKEDEFKKTNINWAQLKVLEEMDLSEKEKNSMQTYYREKLSQDKDYCALMDLKKDMIAVDAIIKHLQKEERTALSEDLKKLRSEYNSAEMKERLPDEKKRLAVRKAMHELIKSRKQNG